MIRVLDPSLPADDAGRVGTFRRRIADRLREGPATNLELSAICNRYGARLLELKRAGFLWKLERVGPGVNRYTMVRDFLNDA